MKRKGIIKKIVISLVALVLAAALGIGGWYCFSEQNKTPVNVYSFASIGMTEYWGDAKETYGPVSTDKIQTVYLSATQTVTEIHVQLGDTVKKGDILMTFDTTLSDLALERMRLDVEKLKLQLENAEERLEEIKRMVPLYIYYPPAPTEPEVPDLGIPLTEAYMVASQDAFDGSTQEKSLVCWISGNTDMDDTLFEALRVKAQELQEKNRQQAAQDATAENGGQDGGAETEPASPAETAPPEETAPVEVNSFYVIFKVTEGDMSLGTTNTWQGFCVTRTPGTGTYTFRLFDASGILDSTIADPPEPVDYSPRIYYNSGYTSAQIAEMRSEQEKLIKELEFSVKMSEAEYKIMQTEVSDGNVYAEVDGEVVSLLTVEEAQATTQPLIKISGGGGFYVQGSVSELDMDILTAGQEVTVSDWNSGMIYSATVSSVGDLPISDSTYSGVGNPNVSYYPFTVFVDGSADLQAGSYVGVTYSSGAAEQGIYLENPFLRTEQGRTYVYVRGTDGLLEKRYVTTGKSLWGSYTEILEGITADDYIAFPYGKNVMSGAETAEADISALYQ